MKSAWWVVSCQVSGGGSGMLPASSDPVPLDLPSLVWGTWVGPWEPPGAAHVCWH